MSRFAVLVSSGGTNLTAIHKSDVEVHLVAADRECPALEYAEREGIPTRLIPRRNFVSNGVFVRDGYTQWFRDDLLVRGIKYVAMAGFGTVFSPVLFLHFQNRILNIHPSLLPQFPGNNAVQQALDANVTETGCTVHIVTPEVDAGKILEQARVPVLPDDTKESLHARIKEAEHELYPRTIAKFMRGEYQL